jgi:asparagine synthase (glutamine-hydrolysing)
MLHADYVTRLPEHTLMLTDRLGMAHGLETRSPFLDHRLVELLARVPAAEKVRGGRTKDLLRRLVARDLPEDVVRRPKQGFMLPVARWLRGPLLPFARRSLGDSRLVAEGHFRKQPIARMLDEHARGRVDHHVRLWMLLALDTWFRLTIDGEGVDALRERFLAQAAPRAGR